MARKNGKETGVRETLADCVVGEVAILRDPLVNGRLDTLAPGSHVKV
jgi:hypothetical protein